MNQKISFNIFNRIFAVFTALIILFAMTGCSNSRLLPEEASSGFSEESSEYSQPYADKDLESFKNFTNDLFREELEDNTLNLHCLVKDPAKYGIEKYTPTLGDVDLDSLDDTADITDTLNRLSTFKYTDLSKEQQLTYDILKLQLETELEYSDLYLYYDPFTPYSGITVTLPILFSEYEFYTKDDVEDYIALLNDLPRYFSGLIEYERLRSSEGLFMSDAVADELIDQCLTFVKENGNDTSFLISTFETRLNDINGLSQEQRDSFISANRKAITDSVLPAYNNVAEQIEKLKGTGKYNGGLANYPNGRTYYEYLIKSNLGWSKSIDELDALLDQYISAAYLSMQVIILDEPDITERLDEFSFSITEPELMLKDLKQKLENDFPAALDVDYTIKNIDKSLEDKSNPAMYIIPQIDNYDHNVIFINNAQCDYETLYPTLAHEGYPGHLYQTTYFADKNTEPIRRILQQSGYIEGWASYVEILSYLYDDRASEDKLFALLQNNQIVMLGLYAKMDMGVNYYGWTKDRLETFLRDWGASSATDTDFLYNYLIAEPATYPNYSIGCFAFMDWKTQASQSIGDKFVLKDFHRFLMDMGPVPFDIIDRKLPEWIEEQKNK